MMTETEIAMIQLGTTDPEASRSWKRQETDSDLEPPEGTSSADNLISTQDSFWTCDLLNSEIINSCCCKLLSLWQCVTAPVGNSDMYSLS